MALVHATQGRSDRALHEMQVALGLAPDNRFVLRSAARFFVHLDKPDEANAILNRSDRVNVDPWLLAAEISTAQLAELGTRGVRRARELLARANFSQHSLSELTSELATTELGSGRDKKARELFRLSLADPTENAIAQAESVADKGHLEIDPGLLRFERGFEARALYAARRAEWEGATSEAVEWHRDQPFSLEPFHFATYTASFGTGDFRLAVELAQLGLKAHPQDRMLRNNAAYALANLGETIQARTYLQHPLFMATEDDFVEVATMGLIHFREGDVEGGRGLYEVAVEGLSKLRRRDLVALAVGHWAVEEARAGTDVASRTRHVASRMLSELPLAERVTLAGRLESTGPKRGSVR